MTHPGDLAAERYQQLVAHLPPGELGEPDHQFLVHLDDAGHLYLRDGDSWWSTTDDGAMRVRARRVDGDLEVVSFRLGREVKRAIVPATTGQGDPSAN